MPHISRVTTIIISGTTSTWLTDKTGTKRCQPYINATLSRTQDTQRQIIWRKLAMHSSVFTIRGVAALRERIADTTTEFQSMMTALVKKTILRTYSEEQGMDLIKMIWLELAHSTRSAELYLFKEFRCQWISLSLWKCWLLWSMSFFRNGAKLRIFPFLRKGWGVDLELTFNMLTDTTLSLLGKLWTIKWIFLRDKDSLSQSNGQLTVLATPST